MFNKTRFKAAIKKWNSLEETIIVFFGIVFTAILLFTPVGKWIAMILGFVLLLSLIGLFIFELYCLYKDYKNVDLETLEKLDEQPKNVGFFMDLDGLKYFSKDFYPMFLVDRLSVPVELKDKIRDIDVPYFYTSRDYVEIIKELEEKHENASTFPGYTSFIEHHFKILPQFPGDVSKEEILNASNEAKADSVYKVKHLMSEFSGRIYMVCVHSEYQTDVASSIGVNYCYIPM